MSDEGRQRLRLWLRCGFFALFVLAPVFDLFRLDLTRGHFVLFGLDWTLGIDDFTAGRIDATELSLRVVLRAFVPGLAFVLGGLWLAWKYGRLYCGWLCPHGSVVETVNALMRRAGGTPSLWERRPATPRQADGSVFEPKALWWLPTALVVTGFAGLWAVTLLTYLLPPAEVWGNLWRLEPTRNQALFIGVATGLFTLEFTLARHLFCRFACAAGLFQSHAWMANRRALVITYQRDRAADCAGCEAVCEIACPMRLKPRTIKRRMFACTQCTACISACTTVQQHNPAGSLLAWQSGEAALAESGQRALRRIEVTGSRKVGAAADVRSEAA